MFAPVTSAPAAGAAVALAGAAVPLAGDPPVAGAVVVDGLELVQPAIEIAITTRIIAITLMCENFIVIPHC